MLSVYIFTGIVVFLLFLFHQTKIRGNQIKDKVIKDMVDLITLISKANHKNSQLFIPEASLKVLDKCIDKMLETSKSAIAEIKEKPKGQIAKKTKLSAKLQEAEYNYKLANLSKKAIDSLIEEINENHQNERQFFEIVSNQNIIEDFNAIVQYN